MSMSAFPTVLLFLPMLNYFPTFKLPDKDWLLKLSESMNLFLHSSPVQATFCTSTYTTDVSLFASGAVASS